MVPNQQYSGISPGSELRNFLWYMRYWGSNPGESHARQTPYPQHFHSGLTLYVFLVINIPYWVKAKVSKDNEAHSTIRQGAGLVHS